MHSRDRGGGKRAATVPPCRRREPTQKYVETHQHQHQHWCAGSRTNRQADVLESADGKQVPLNEPAQERGRTSGGRSGGPHHSGFAVQLHQRLHAAALALRRGAVLLGLVRGFYGRQLLLLLLQPAGDVLVRQRTGTRPALRGMSCRGGNAIFREETTQFKTIEPQARRASKVVDGNAETTTMVLEYLESRDWRTRVHARVYTCTMVQAQHTNAQKNRARHRGRAQLEVLHALRAIKIDGLSHAGAHARDTPVVLEGTPSRPG